MSSSESDRNIFKNLLLEQEAKYQSFDKQTVLYILEEIEDKKYVHNCFLNDQEKNGTPTGIAFVEGQLAAFKQIEHFLRTEILKQTYSNGKYYD